MVTKVDDKEIEKQLDYMHKISERVHGLKYSINTMGCKLNENDSEKISGMLETMGYVKTDNFEDANLVIQLLCKKLNQ